MNRVITRPGFFLINTVIMANNAQEAARTVALPAHQLLLQ